MSGYQVTWRDRLAYRLGNLVMKIATPEYRALIKVGHMKAIHDVLPQVKWEKPSTP